MSGLKEIKNRIISIKNTQQITKAMKMVSASKLRQVQTKLENSRPYSKSLLDIIKHVVPNTDTDNVPFLKHREKGNAGIVLITSDKGLCGGLNANLNKKLAAFIEALGNDHDKISLYCVGKKGRDYFVKRDREVAEELVDLGDTVKIVKLDGLVDELIEAYRSESMSALYVAYTEFKSVISHVPVIRKILPVAVDEGETNIAENDDVFLFEPNPADVLNGLLPKYIRNSAYIALLESIASEHGARMSSMDSATRNAGDMIAKYQLYYNRARQAAITTELTEIISGAESIQ